MATTERMLKQAADQIGKDDPIEPVLNLWEALRNVGSMPSLEPGHMREILIALRKERNECAKLAADMFGAHAIAQAIRGRADLRKSTPSS